jgi:hypothetical protein
MAHSVFFKTVQNHEELRLKGVPWLCDKCHKEDEILLKVTIDYTTLIICKKCLLEMKKMITVKEKELKDDRSNSSL